MAHSTLYEAITLYRRLIPESILIEYISNVKSAVAHLGVEGVISLACACSGTVAWKHYMNTLFIFWENEFDIQALGDHRFACEIDSDKRAFIAQQHPDVGKLFTDVRSLSERTAMNMRDGTMAMIDWVSIFGGGFSCLLKTPLNSSRSSNKFCVQKEQGSTGETFKGVKEYIVKVRPAISVLENLKEMSQKPKDKPCKHGSLYSFFSELDH